MKILLVTLIELALLQSVYSDFVFPPEIASGISKSRTGESDGLFIHGVDESKFLEYICSNWREIAENIEMLPKAEGSFSSEQGAFNCAVNTFGAACEWLPAEEYLDFMDKFIDLYEQKRIGYMPFHFQLGASAKKADFLAVNWEHPRVKAIFAKARRLIPPSEEATLSWLDDAASGELADNYMTNKSENSPLPETLPGITFKRPWDSLIKKYERVTGNKVDVPYNSRYNPRPEKNSRAAPPSVSIPGKMVSAFLSPWFWMIAGGLVVFIGIFLKVRQSTMKRRET